MLFFHLFSDNESNSSTSDDCGGSSNATLGLSGSEDNSDRDCGSEAAASGEGAPDHSNDEIGMVFKCVILSGCI